MPNRPLFKQLVSIAKKQHRDSIQWFIGGNAPLMGIRFDKEGWEVLLGARMSEKLVYSKIGKLAGYYISIYKIFNADCAA